MTAVLIAEGPNGLEIPCMLFESFDQGIEYASKALNRGPDNDRFIGGRRSISWNVEFGDTYNHVSKTVGEGPDDPAIPSFFRGYYDGCGGCHRLSLKEVPFGVPFIHWDLD